MLDFDLTPEQKTLVEETKRFTREKIIPVAGEADKTHEFPMDVFKEAWELGLVGPTIPEEYGGAGMTEVDNVLLTEELAFGCTGIQTSMTANTLAATPILIAGSDEQKKKYLGLLTAEPVFASYAITESSAGSDAAGLQTRVRKDGNDYIINGEKIYITNGAWARWYIVFATVDPALRHKGIMAFIIDRDAPGVSVGKTEDKLGQRASNTAVINFEDVRLTSANLLAEEGHWFKLAMQTFDRKRPDIGAGACGIMRRSLE